MGIDPKLLASIINTSSGRCWSSEIYNPVPGVTPNAPASRNYAGGFGTKLMRKDLGLAQQAALESGTSVFLGTLAGQIYQHVSDTEKNGEKFGDLDFSVVYKWLSQQQK